MRDNAFSENKRLCGKLFCEEQPLGTLVHDEQPVAEIKNESCMVLDIGIPMNDVET